MQRVPIILRAGLFGVLLWLVSDAPQTHAAPPQTAVTHPGFRQSCTSDAYCRSAAYCSNGGSCTSGVSNYPYCNPKSNRCDVCIEDHHCPSLQVCRQTDSSGAVTNSCASSTAGCPNSCTTDKDCQNARCGNKVKCLSGKCNTPPTASNCEPPNLIIVLDRSCSMYFTGGSLVDSGFACSSTTQCRTTTHNPDMKYFDFMGSSTCEGPTGAKTCRYTRWDTAINALVKSVDSYGGTLANSYNDRKVRFGLVFFSNGSYHTNVYGSAWDKTNSIYHRIVQDDGTVDPPTVVKQALIDATAGGGTNYWAGLDLARNMMIRARNLDTIPNRKTAILFVTDGDPSGSNTNSTCTPQMASLSPFTYAVKGTTHGGQCNCAEWKVNQVFNDFGNQNKTYVVGFGNGLGTAGKNCLNDIAHFGRTKPANCAGGSCLYYAANNAASLASAFQEIIDNATAEVCDGLDNNCDGRTDENVPGCTCLKSYTKNVSTSYINRNLTQNQCTTVSGSQKVKQYTFLSTFSETNDNSASGNTYCLANPNDPNSQRIDQIYNAICRNDAKQAAQCGGTGTTNSPPGTAWGIYCQRCTNFGGNGCLWPLYHACNGTNRVNFFAGADGSQTAWDGCKNWCKNNYIKALNCMMPQGKLERSGLCEDPNDGRLVPEPQAYLEFGKQLDDTRNLSSPRTIFVNVERLDGLDLTTNGFTVPNSVDLSVNRVQTETRNHTPSTTMTGYNPTTKRFDIYDDDANPPIAILQPGGISDIANAQPGTVSSNTLAPAAEHRLDPINVTFRRNLRLRCNSGGATDQCALGCRGAYCCTQEECYGGCDQSGNECKEEFEFLVNFIRGYDTTSPKLRSFKLGAIYHSTPALLTRPLSNREDPRYNDWLKTQMAGGIGGATIGASRPTVLFVGSNDGIMHAFHADSGMELWGFIPKTVLPNLKYAVRGMREGGGRVYTTDGSPVVGNYQMFRFYDGNSGEVYAKFRSVLLFGMGMGGRGYVAIDVTDPFRPRLMWEINHHSYKDPKAIVTTPSPDNTRFDRLGYTVGRPLIANVLVRWDISTNRPSANANAMERAVAILPGGVNININNSPPTYTMDKNNNHIGAVVYIVDLETGMFLSEIVPYDLMANNTCKTATGCTGSYRPLEFYDARGVTGTPVGYPIEPAPMTRFFFGDAHGRIFRVDLGCPDVAAWGNVNPTTGQPQMPKCNGVDVQNTHFVHDPFKYNTSPQPVMSSMALALNPRGELVLSGGTGDLTNVESYDATNKTFSLREILGSLGEFRYLVHAWMGDLNKYNDRDNSQTLLKQYTAGGYTGEKFTGDPVIANGITYFTTFDVASDTLPVCGLPGEARLYGIRYEEPCTDATCLALKNASRYNNDRTPVEQCNALTSCNTHSNPPECQNEGMRTQYVDGPKASSPVADARCNDINYTQPMLITEPPVTQPNDYQFYRYHAFGKNTLSMGPTVSYTPGDLQNVPRDPTDPKKGSNVEVKKSGKLAVQVSLSRLSGANQFLQPPNSVVKNATNNTGSGNAPVMMNTPPSNKTIMATDWVLVLDN